MKHYQDFQITRKTFRERVGSPTEVDAAVGMIAQAFASLEHTAYSMILLLADADPGVVSVLATPLSFRQRVAVLSDLVRLDSFSQNVVPEQLDELFCLCLRAEELKDRYLQEVYATKAPVIHAQKYHGKEKGSKVLMKRRDRLSVRKQSIKSSLLVDVSDFIARTESHLELLGILEPDAADLIPPSLKPPKVASRGKRLVKC